MEAIGDNNFCEKCGNRSNLEEKSDIEKARLLSLKQAISNNYYEVLIRKRFFLFN